MREILFRGKAFFDGAWVEGDLRHGGYFLNDNTVYIMRPVAGTFENIPVEPATVGQYTGLTDKNGKKIFEGDIIETDNGKSSSCFIVKFGEYYPKMFFSMMDRLGYTLKHIPAVGFYGESLGTGEEVILFQSPCVTVIGNIHDNPELLAEEVDDG